MVQESEVSEPEVTVERGPELRKEKGRSVLASVLSSGAKVAPSKSDPLAITVYVPSSPRSITPKPLPSPRTSPVPPKSVESGSPTPQAILDNKSRQKRVKINVGGEKHEILWENLGKQPDTRLGQLKNARSHEEILELCEDYSLEDNEYFFDRQPKAFAIILNLYRTSKLHLAEEICVVEFLDELEYWGVDEHQLDPCCQLKLQQRRDQINDDVKKDSELLFIVGEDEFGDSNLDKIKKHIWDLFEKSLTLPQRITGFLSLFFILLSVLTLSLSTVPDLQELGCKSTNQSACVYAVAQTQNMTMTEAADAYPEELEVKEHYVLDELEIVCIVWFTLEYLLRMFAAPNKPKFFRGWLNTIDLIAILPFYVSLFLVHFDTAGRVLQVLRVIRILRIFKLARHSTGLQSLGFTLRHSYQNLGVLLLFIAVGVIIFSALAYFAERDDNSRNFESIPHSFYWALITMTTVGYGDIVPTTIIGKIISMVAGVCGLVVIALPVGIISNNFQLFYEEQKRKEKAFKRRKEMEKFKDKSQGKSSYLQVSLGDNLNPGGGDDPKAGSQTSQL
ncbi:Potassium voltage-gated channel protein Shab [Orchesella cincta]|uniref:Potassium voltage-gated channel protein Shab n=1 Tax=Orchesella cincta TaxID=48709 RepID=A0A1D2MYE4_ORCCI|nr:Potassium voltage-gated channel protein Shab [Orchesella cincta]